LSYLLNLSFIHNFTHDFYSFDLDFSL